MSSFVVNTTEEEDTREVDFSGQVTKWPVGGFMGSAKKRFMVLKAGTISYYENESSYLGGDASLNSYHLNPSSIIKRTEETIKVEIVRGKGAILFKSKGEIQRWEDCLTNSIEKLLKDSGKADEQDEDVGINGDYLGSEEKLNEHQDYNNPDLKLLGGNIVKKPKSGGFGGAKKRYLVLNPVDATLRYYENIGAFEHGSKPKGTFELTPETDIMKVEGDHHTVDIRLESKKESFEFRAVGQENQWLNGISVCLDKVSGTTTTTSSTSSIEIETIGDLRESTIGAAKGIDTTIDSDDNDNTGIATKNNVASGNIIKWPTSGKRGGAKPRYLEIEGDIISYYTAKDGVCKNSFRLDATSTIKIENDKIELTYGEKEKMIFLPGNVKSPNFRRSIEGWYGILSERIARAKCLYISIVTTMNNALTYHALNAVIKKLEFDGVKNIRFNLIVVTDPEYASIDDQEEEVKVDNSGTNTKVGQYFKNISKLTEATCNKIESYSIVSFISELKTDALSTRLLQSESCMLFCNTKSDGNTKTQYIRKVEAAARKASIEGGLTFFSIDEKMISPSSQPFELCLPVYQDDTWGEYGDFPSATFGIPIIAQNDKELSEFYETGFEEKIRFQALPNLAATAKDSLLQMNLTPTIVDLLLYTLKDLHVHLLELFPEQNVPTEEVPQEENSSKDEKVENLIEDNTSSTTNAF